MSSPEFAEVHYTINGSRPTSTSDKFESSIKINETSVIRARAFTPDKITSNIVTHSYLINENQTLSVISISAFPENL